MIRNSICEFGKLLNGLKLPACQSVKDAAARLKAAHVHSAAKKFSPLFRLWKCLKAHRSFDVEHPLALFIIVPFTGIYGVHFRAPLGHLSPDIRIECLLRASCQVR